MKRFEALKCGISEPQTNTEIFQKHWNGETSKVQIILDVSWEQKW
jgi:hypothetical protein